MINETFYFLNKNVYLFNAVTSIQIRLFNSYALEKEKKKITEEHLIY